MNPAHEYEWRRLDGTVFAPRHFIELPPQFKALSWLYADDRKDAPTYAHLMLKSLVQERVSRVGVRK